MPIPDSVKVTFKGSMKEYMDFRDVVHATQSQMLQQFGGENVFQGRIIEVHIGTLTADQAFTFHRLVCGNESKSFYLYF